MNKDDFASLKRGLEEAKAYLEGDRTGFITHTPVDIKALRKAIGKTQGQFAAAYHLPIGTVRDWEQGRRTPDAPAKALLAIIAKDPEQAEKLLADA